MVCILGHGLYIPTLDFFFKTCIVISLPCALWRLLVTSHSVGFGIYLQLSQYFCQQLVWFSLGNLLNFCLLVHNRPCFKLINRSKKFEMKTNFDPSTICIYHAAKQENWPCCSNIHLGFQFKPKMRGLL